MLTVLFVCTGNICRSPLAAAFLADCSNRLLGGRVRVLSAGTWGSDGSPISPNAAAFAAERGLDASGHRARRLTPELLEEADLILALAREHLDEILRLVPHVEPKTFGLKELAALLGDMPVSSGGEELARERIGQAHRARTGGSAWDVGDPYGFDMDVYREMGTVIEDAVDRIVEGLFGVGTPVGER